MSRSGWAAPRSSLELVGAFGDEADDDVPILRLVSGSDVLNVGRSEWAVRAGVPTTFGNEDGEDDESVPSGGWWEGERRARGRSDGVEERAVAEGTAVEGRALGRAVSPSSSPP